MMETTPLNRILGVDFGEKRIGLALSDPLCIIAQPWGFEQNTSKGLEAIAERIRTEGVTTVVVGMPFSLKGEEGASAARVRAFIADLRERTTATIITWDERFTTTMANASLRVIGKTKKSRNTRTGRVDAMAASILLQSFLDSTKHSRVC